MLFVSTPLLEGKHLNTLSYEPADSERQASTYEEDDDWENMA